MSSYSHGGDKNNWLFLGMVINYEATWDNVPCENSSVFLVSVSKGSGYVVLYIYIVYVCVHEGVSMSLFVLGVWIWPTPKIHLWMLPWKISYYFYIPRKL